MGHKHGTAYGKEAHIIMPVAKNKNEKNMLICTVV
jgi:hypothetical protein